MNNTIFEKAVKRYNKIMFAIGYEQSTIDTEFSEKTNGWNLRDIIAESSFILSTYNEPGHINEELKHGDAQDRKIWKSETGKLERFIKSYKPYINNIKCVSRHCSMFDN